MEVQTAAEQLLFVTVRIETDTPQGVGTGTASIFSYERDDVQYPFLVTNKHVVANATQGRFFFTEQGNDNKPLIGQRLDFIVDDFQHAWHGHSDPDVDITVMPLVPVLQDIQGAGRQVFYRSIPNSFIPTPEQGKDLDAVEEILFVGYPSGIFDATNLLPIVRRGTSATPFQINYEGRPTFLIDASVFPGSSGSPVFIASSGGYADRSGGFVIGSRVLFLGVVAQVLIRLEQGQIDFQPIPTAHAPIIRMNQMIDLGVVYKSSVVVENIEDYLRARGELK